MAFDILGNILINFQLSHLHLYFLFAQSMYIHVYMWYICYFFTCIQYFVPPGLSWTTVLPLLVTNTCTVKPGN